MQVNVWEERHANLDLTSQRLTEHITSVPEGTQYSGFAPGTEDAWNSNLYMVIIPY